MGWQRKAWNYISGGKSLCSSSKEENAKPRTQPGLAVALALVLATLVLSIAIPYARAADPGHPASAISGSTFDTGDFIFPTNLTVNKFFIANSTTLYVDAINGRVGIGTTSPTVKLEIRDSDATTNSIFNVYKIFAYSTGDMVDGFGGGLLFGIADSGIAAGASIASVAGVRDGADTQGALILRTRASGEPAGGLEKMRITNTGNVGIGTASPSTKLDVNGSLNITDASGRIRTPELCLTADSCRTTWPTGGAGWAASGNYVYNDTAAAKVGIGTATPQQKLDVIGTVNATDYICTGGSDCIGATEINSTSLASECSTITGSAGLCDGLDDTCSNSACTVGSDDTLTNPTVGGALSMANYPISNIGSTDTDFTSDGGLTLHGNFSVLGTGTQTIAGNTSFDGGTLFVDSNNDRVGIGTTTPTVLLDAVGTASAVLIRVKTTNADTDSAISITNDANTWLLQTRGYDLADAFVIRESGVGDRLTILSGGNVGIGTTSPSKKLEVSNSTQGITFDPTVINPVINTTANNLTITSAGGNVIIQLG